MSIMQTQNDISTSIHRATSSPDGDYCPLPRVFVSTDTEQPAPHQRSTHWETNVDWINSQMTASPAEKAAAVRDRIVADYSFNPLANPADVAARHLIDATTATDLRAQIAQALSHIYGLLDADKHPFAVQNVAEAITSAIARQVERARGRLMQQQDKIRELTGCEGISEVTDTQLQDTQAAALMAETDEQIAEIAHQAATDAYRETTGQHWKPTTRSTAFSAMHTDTAAVRNANFFLTDRRNREQMSITAPTGYKVAVGGGIRDNRRTVQPDLVWAKLDKLKAAHPDLYLILTDEPGANQPARDWATRQRVKHIVLVGDFKSNPKSAGFRRNEGVVAAQPNAYLIFPGTGVTENLVDLARQAGGTILRATTTPAAS